MASKILISLILMSVGAHAETRTLSFVGPDGKVFATDEGLSCASLARDGLNKLVLNTGFVKSTSQRIREATERHRGKQVEVRLCGKSHSLLKVLAPIDGALVTIAAITPTEEQCLKRAIARQRLKPCAVPSVAPGDPIPQ